MPKIIPSLVYVTSCILLSHGSCLYVWLPLSIHFWIIPSIVDGRREGDREGGMLARIEKWMFGEPNAGG